jgi:DNA-binding winged helix-turn-helix (wHTH) protein
MLLPITRLQIGDYAVDFNTGEMRKDGISSQLDGRIARLLMYLAHRPGEVVSIDEMLDQVWEGVVVSPDSVYQAITALRKALGDDQKNPSYIVTVPRRGYKLIASVSNYESTILTASDGPAASSKLDGIDSESKGRYHVPVLIAVLAACVVVALIVFVKYSGGQVGAQSNSKVSVAQTQPVHSIAVLPFLDLTDTMTVWWKS